MTSTGFWVSSVGAIVMLANPGLLLAASAEEGEILRKTGTVLSVDATNDNESFVFQDRNKKEMTVHVEPFTVFTRTGDLSSDFEALQENDRIYVWGVLLADGSMNAYEVHNRSIIPGNIPVNSEIRAIDATKNEITTGTGNKERTVSVTDETQIILGPNQDAILADLQVGDVVETGYGPRRKDEPIEAVRLVIDRANLQTTEIFAEGKIKRLTGDQFPYTATVAVPADSSTTIDVKITATSTIFNKQFAPSSVNELMTDDRVEFWHEPSTMEVDWLRNLSLKNVSTKGIAGTIVEKNEAENMVSVAWLGGVYEVLLTSETDIIVRKNRNATIDDLLIGMTVRARGEKHEGASVITATTFVVPTGTQSHREGKGTGEVRYQGTGQAVFTGSGSVEAKGKKGTVLVRDFGANVNVETTGTGSKVQIDATTWKYQGFGSVKVTGTDVVVLLQGVGVTGLAQGTGTYALTGKGTYRTSGHKAQSIPTAGIVLTTQPLVSSL